MRLNFDYFIKRKILPGFKINRQELVLDIGSGDKPFWRGDVFLDKLSLGNDQRNTNSNTITNLGLFVNSDVSQMPFKDKIFDFSFCAHLLEHVENPDRALKEIMRVSKKGYIEIPNGWIDSVDPFNTHLWSIYKNENKLIFIRKDKKTTEIFKKNGRMFKKLIRKSEDPFIRFYWNKKINYEVINNLKKEEEYVPKPEKILRSNKLNTFFYKFIIRTLRLSFYKKKQINLDEIKK